MFWKALKEPSASARSPDASDGNAPPELELEDISMALSDKGRAVGTEEEEEEEQVRTVRANGQLKRKRKRERGPTEQGWRPCEHTIEPCGTGRTHLLRVAAL